jgi:catalase-peroxidase
MGWKNKCGKGNAEDTVTSGLEGAWTVTPTKWSMNYLQNLFNFEWVQTKSPGGATQWIPKNPDAASLVPDAHIPGKRNAPVMLTTDLSLRFDPEYEKISRRFLENPEEFEDAFARAWFKLTHRDMGPRARYVGGPDVDLLWQDPVPPVDYTLIGQEEVTALKNEVLESGLSIPALIRTAWASASTFRGTDMRGGANGARIRLAPQVGWDVNNPDELEDVLEGLGRIQRDFNRSKRDGTKVSMADMIVLAGDAAVAHAAKKAGYDVSIPFTPGRTDATQEQTDIESFEMLRPKADAFRNYYGEGAYRSPVDMMVDKADTLTLTVPEMTVLIGGMRALGANAGGAEHGVFTDQPGTLSNDFFVNLLSMDTSWSKSEKADGIYEGRDRESGKLKWTATPVDLVFGANGELRAIAEVYAASGGEEKFVNDFVDAWKKVMTLDRFDVPQMQHGAAVASR